MLGVDRAWPSFSAGRLLCHCASLSLAILLMDRPLTAEVSSAFAESGHAASRL